MTKKDRVYTTALVYLKRMIAEDQLGNIIKLRREIDDYLQSLTHNMDDYRKEFKEEE